MRDPGSTPGTRRRHSIAYWPALLIAAAAVVVAVGTPANAAVPMPAGHLIVLLKDQLTHLPPTASGRAQRHSAALVRQNSSARRAAPGANPSGVRHFSVGNGFAVDATAAQTAALEANPAVAAVVPDEPLTPSARTWSADTGRPADTGRLDGVRGKDAPPTGVGTSPVCPADPAKPQREPQALGLIHTPVGPDAPTGAGVRVGVIADRVDPANADFTRPDGTPVIADYRDFTGTGTVAADTVGEAFGDVSAIAAQGTVVHDLHAFTPNVPAGCTIRVHGVAPGASVVALSAIGVGSTLSAVLQAVDYAVNTAHVDVLNESFSSSLFPDAGARNAVQLFNDQAVAGGVTVVASSGDAGVTDTIGSPASDPGVISVGATTSFRLRAQLGMTGTNGRWADGNIANFSSSGFTTEGHTINLVAPGFSGWAACTVDNESCGNPAGVFPFAGTSQSAPFTSGAAALVIQAYRHHHQGRSPSPVQVERYLTGTARDLGALPQDQGAGLLDVTAATRAAAGDDGVVLSADQIDLTGPGGSHRSRTITATNTGHRQVVVAPSLVRYVPLSHTEQTRAMAAPVDVSVPPGAAQLTVRMIIPGSLSGSYQLNAPDGTLVNTTSNSFTAAETLSAVHPAAGTWRLVPLIRRPGVLTVVSDTTRAETVGDVQPANLVLPPGATRTLTVALTTAPDAGDAAYALRLSGTTVPVSVRTLVAGSFAGVLATGTGRIGAPVQTHTYAFDVPTGKPALTVTTALAPVLGDRPDEVAGVLVDPDGDALSIARNGVSTDDLQPGLLQTVQRPVPGRWRLILVTQNMPQTLAETFTGTIRFDAAIHSTANLPHGTLPAGRASTSTVRVTNPGPLPLTIGVDARSTATASLALTPLAPTNTEDGAVLRPTSATVPLPGGGAVGYLVPPGATGLTVTSTGTERNQVFLSSPAGGTQAFGSPQGSVSTAHVSVAAPGLWAAAPQVVGPFGAQGAPAGTADLTATVQAPRFDRTVTSSVADDPYLISVDGTADAARLVTVPPGATVAVPVTFTPTAARGTRIRGTLNLVTPVSATADLSTFVGGGLTVTTGDVLASLPYTYTVG